MPLTESYDVLLKEILQDEDRALAYLDASLEEDDPRLFLIALRNVAQARGGVGKISRRAGLNRESMYRALSAQGNPSVQTLAAILSAMGARLSVDRIKKIYRSTEASRPILTFTMMGRTAPALSWQTPRHGRGIQLAAA